MGCEDDQLVEGHGQPQLAAPPERVHLALASLRQGT